MELKLEPELEVLAVFSFSGMFSFSSSLSFTNLTVAWLVAGNLVLICEVHEKHAKLQLSFHELLLRMILSILYKKQECYHSCLSLTTCYIEDHLTTLLENDFCV